jgi:uracil-DNA glycosylase
VTLLIGMYALRWHLPPGALKADMTETVRNWRALGDEANKTRIFPLPHPSWRNNGWLKRAPWFEAELLPDLRASIKEALSI